MLDTVAAPLIITAAVRAALRRLREDAARKPIAILDLAEQLKSPGGKRRHMKRMTEQSVMIPGPWPFMVCFSIETGHPCGTVRHMSMSAERTERVPHPDGVWMVAEDLGFTDSLQQCSVWLENLSDGRQAVNVAQPITMHAGGTA